MSLTRFSLLASATAVAFSLSACTTVPPQQVVKPAETVPPVKPVDASKGALKLVGFDALPGWSKDDLREAWPAFLASCEVLAKKSDWKEPCLIARDVDAKNENAVRIFFEAFFAPYRILNADGTD